MDVHGEKVTDTALGAFKLDNFPSLKSLSVAGTTVTDRWLADFLSTVSEEDGRSQLRSLNVSANAKISDSAFAELKKLKNLQSLSLSRTKITGKSLSQLKASVLSSRSISATIPVLRMIQCTS